MPRSAFPHIRVTSSGLRLTTISSFQASVTLPLADDGAFPRYIRLMAEPSTASLTGYAYVKVGNDPLTASTTDILVTGNEALILQTRGMSRISVIGSSTTVYINCIPLEDC